METKFSTGDAVLIPAIIRNASEKDGQIFYQVDADIWEGIPEGSIVKNEKTEAAIAMKAFADSFSEKWR